jgi:hypothetical protein
MMVSAASDFSLEDEARSPAEEVYCLRGISDKYFPNVTRNGRGPPRFRDAQDVMFVPFIKKY